MNDLLWYALPWMLGLTGLFSFLTVSAWATERRREREAYYRSDAIKKIAELQGNPPESVLQLLREALTPRPERPYAWMPRNNAYYQGEAIMEIARMSGAAPAMEFLREQQKSAALVIRARLRLGGSLSLAAGLGLMPFLRFTAPNPVFLVGLIPTFIGIALLTYSYVLIPKS